MSLSQFVAGRFWRRLVPFIFFTLLMIIPTFFFAGKFFGLELPSATGYAQGLVSTAFGIPLFCIPSWFLLLIIGVELVHFAFFRFVRDADWKLLIAAVAFYLVGYLVNFKLDIFNPLRGRTVGWNYFFIHEAVTLYGFYLIGVYLRRRRCFAEPMAPAFAVVGALLGCVAVLFTFQRNGGPFNFDVYDAVVILFASHGHILLFPLTALAGSLMVLFMADAARVPRLISYMGSNTLILMCLNGIFYHYVNPPLARWVLDNLGGSPLTVTASAIVTTVATLLLCVPLVFLFNRYTPRLVGKGIQGTRDKGQGTRE